jgi:hypothetical protein
MLSCGHGKYCTLLMAERYKKLKTQYENENFYYLIIFILTI